ncbi:MAG TPA: right-handed parallel beta-helix repeat-containing protein, partial [Flavobacteriales bacterium]|nr:right-handed parallel beta-helix repeat-containing protein [Flavobacteriales bacterium]
MGVAKSQNVNVTATAGTTSGTYPNLSTAFASINNGTHQGAITVDITASFTDVATAFLNSSGASTGSSYTSVLVRPTVDAVTISFASASGFGVIDINGADNVTIDGDNPNTAGTNRNLTIVNTAASTTTFTSVIRVAVGTIAPQLDNNNITIKNIIANGSATSCNSAALTSATVGGQNTTFGVVVAPGGGPTSSFAVTNTTTPFNASATVNAFMVDNCAINQCGRGIAFLGAGATSSTGITITNNTLGTAAALGTYPFTTPTTTVYTQGIFVTGANSVTITGNTLNNIVSYVGVAMNGITLNASMGSGTFTISNNTITAVTNNGTSASSSNGILIASATTGATYTISGNTISNIQNSGGASNGGIFISGGSATSGLISNNIISTVYARSTGGWGARGIYLNSGSNITVQNNMIRDISMCPNNSATTTTFGARGILINAGTGHKIYNNSVYLSGPVFTSSNTDVTSCLGIAGTGLTGIDVRNNIFSNTMTGGSATTPHACIQLPSGATSTMNLTLNNNAYYSGSTATSYIGILATTFTGYSAANFNPAATSPATNMRAYTSTLSVAGTNDNASFASTAAAPFISSTDLHLNTGAANITDVDAKAAVIATVTTDIDGNTRDAATPDMGADEVSVAGCVTATGGSIAPTTATVCAGLTYAMSATGSSTGSGITYQWEISTTGGGIGFGNVSGGTGATTVSYTTAALTAGIYYYRLRTTCSSGPVIAYSNELTLTVNALPTISVTPPSAAACGTISQTLTASGASTYTWSPATGLSGTTGTNVTASPTSTTTYTVTGTDVNTCVNTTSVTITIDVMPSTPIMTPSSVNICTGGSTTLNATSSFPTTGTLGTGTSTTTLATTTSTTYPNPYSHYYGGNKHQYLILASELSAMGLSAGSSISSIGFNIASVNTTVPLQSFEIKMGHTAITTIAAFQTGLTIVSPAATYTTGAAPGVNTHTLGTPFVWNGTSNIVLETSYSNNDFSTTGNNTITYS